MLRPKAAVVLLMLVFWSSAAFAQIFKPPLLIRFTGALFPIEKEGQRNLYHTLNVLIKGEERWIFRLDKVEPLTSTNNGWAILQRLFPPRVCFTGPEDLLHLLQKPEIAGKPLIIEGRLYIRAKMFLITAVEEAEEKPKQTRPAGIL